MRPEPATTSASPPSTIDPQSLISLVDEAVRRGIALSVRADGKLGFRAPSGALTDELRANLTAHRDALVDMISGPRFRVHGPREQIPFLEYGTGLWKRIRDGNVGVRFTNGTRWIAKVEGPFSTAAFAAGVDFVAARNDILNVTIRELDGMPHFCWGRTARLQFVDLATGSEAPGTSDLTRAVTDIVWRPFEPEVDILFRPFVVRVSESCHVIGFVLNHLIGDLVSVRLLRNQLGTAYESAVCGNTLEASAPGMQYSDYILTMNAWLAGPARSYRLAYWRRQLNGVVPCQPPADRCVAEQPTEIRVYRFSFDAEQTASIHHLARELSTTVYFVLVAAYARALSSATHQRSVAFTSVYHGRDDPATTKLVGSMQGQLLLRIPAAQSEPFASLVRVAQRVQSEALEFQLPLEILCKDIPDLPPYTAYPEFNFFYARGVVDQPASPSSETHSASHEVRRRMKRLEVTVPTDVKCASASPGINWIVRADDSAIRMAIVYLAAEYDYSTIERFAATIVASIESAKPSKRQLAVG